MNLTEKTTGPRDPGRRWAVSPCHLTVRCSPSSAGPRDGCPGMIHLCHSGAARRTAGDRLERGQGCAGRLTESASPTSAGRPIRRHIPGCGCGWPERARDRQDKGRRHIHWPRWSATDGSRLFQLRLSERQHRADRDFPRRWWTEEFPNRCRDPAAGGVSGAESGRPRPGLRGQSRQGWKPVSGGAT